jgi:hypothetical protein
MKHEDLAWRQMLVSLRYYVTICTIPHLQLVLEHQVLLESHAVSEVEVLEMHLIHLLLALRPQIILGINIRR